MNRVLAALVTASMFAAPVLASAAEGHEEVGAMPSVKQGLATGFTAVIVFVIVAAFLGAFVWPKISKGLDERADKIKNEIESAEAARMQAKSALAQYERSLAEARAEAQKMLEQAKAQQQAQFAEIKAKNETELSMMKDKAMREIEAAKKQALTEIYSESAALATSVAGKILSREINRNDQSQLVQMALGEMKPSHARA
jgi:F-type H+-transporting ATPase subunit b